MSTEPKDQREIVCTSFMRQSIFVHADEFGSQKTPMVCIEAQRGSFDLGRAEALELAAAIVWAANGGRTG